MIYIIYLLIMTLILIFVFYQIQFFMMFTPTYHKRDALNDDFELLSITMNDGIELEGVIYEPHKIQKDELKTVLFFAGRSHDSVALIKKLSENFPQVRIITFNYRSYGESQGRVSEKNLFEDGEHIANVIEKNYGEFYLLGFSLGTTIATHIASKTKTKALFLIGAFDSIALLSKERFGIGASWIWRYKFETIKTIKNVYAPCYIFSSRNDKTTYVKNARNLKNSVQNLVTYMEFETLTHKELLWNKKVIKKINGVINEA